MSSHDVAKPSPRVVGSIPTGPTLSCDDARRIAVAAQAEVAQTSRVIRMCLVPLEGTLELRDRMLSPGHPGRPVIWPYDDEQATHWGAFDDDHVIGCVSCCPGSIPGFPAAHAYRFHSMAVDAPRQGQGVGRLMLKHIAQELHGAGAELLFATARDSALGFYLRCGMQPGGTFTVAETGFNVRYVTLGREAMTRL
jgi:GNAT superfamily N-acetyltransferase